MQLPLAGCREQSAKAARIPCTCICVATRDNKRPRPGIPCHTFPLSVKQRRFRKTIGAATPAINYSSLVVSGACSACITFKSVTVGGSSEARARARALQRILRHSPTLSLELTRGEPFGGKKWTRFGKVPQRIWEGPQRFFLPGYFGDISNILVISLTIPTSEMFAV